MDEKIMQEMVHRGISLVADHAALPPEEGRVMCNCLKTGKMRSCVVWDALNMYFACNFEMLNDRKFKFEALLENILESGDISKRNVGKYIEFYRQHLIHSIDENNTGMDTAFLSMILAKLELELKGSKFRLEIIKG